MDSPTRGRPRASFFRDVAYVERSGALRAHLLLDGDPVLRVAARRADVTDLRAIETDEGRAVAFTVETFLDGERQVYGGIAGDSGVALLFEHESKIVGLDAERLLLVEGSEQRPLSVLRCAGSRAAADLTCETPEDRRLRDGREVEPR